MSTCTSVLFALFSFFVQMSVNMNDKTSAFAAVRSLLSLKTFVLFTAASALHALLLLFSDF